MADVKVNVVLDTKVNSYVVAVRDVGAVVGAQDAIDCTLVDVVKSTSDGDATVNVKTVLVE